MNLLLLPGNNLNNKGWAYEARAALAPLFDRCVVHEYAHWTSGAAIADIDLEIEALRQATKGLDDYAIFAKSIGTVIASKGIHEGVLNPSKCIFTGAPLPLIKSQAYEYTKWLTVFGKPILFVQNSHDPVAGYEELKTYLRSSELTNYELVELPGDTHSYDDFAMLKNLVKNFVFAK